MVIGIPEKYTKLILLYIHFSKSIKFDDDVKKAVETILSLINDEMFVKNYKRYYKFSEKDDFYDILFAIFVNEKDFNIDNVENIIRTKFFNEKNYITKLDELLNIINKLSQNPSQLFNEDVKNRFIDIVSKIYYIFKIKIASDVVKSLSDNIKTINDVVEKNVITEYEKVIGYLNSFNTIDVSSDDVILNFDTSIFDRINKITTDMRYANILREIDFIETCRVAVFLGATGGGKSMVLSSLFGDYLTSKIYDDDYLLFYFTFENSVEETMLRIYSRITQEDINKIKSNIHDDEYKNDLMEIVKKEVNHRIKPVIVYLPPNIHTTQSIDEKIQYYLNKFKKHKVLAVFVDYILLMKSTSYNVDRRIDVGNVVLDLKYLAKKYNTPVITASQLNRGGVENIKKSKLVDETNIAESFLIVNNADIVIAFNTQDTNIKNIKTIMFYVLKHRYSSSSGIYTYNANFSKATIYPSSYKLTINNNTFDDNKVNEDEYSDFTDFEDDASTILWKNGGEYTMIILPQVSMKIHGYSDKMLRYFLDVLKRTEQLSTCSYYKVACLIVKDNRIVITSYNGTPSNFIQCDEFQALIDYIKNDIRSIEIFEDIHRELQSDFSVDLSTLNRINNREVYATIIKYLINNPKHLYEIVGLLLNTIKNTENYTNIIHSKYEIHAEQNAIVYASRFGVNLLDADMFVSYLPCFECSKIIIQSGIKRVFYLNDYTDKRFFDNTVDFLQKNNIKVVKIKQEVDNDE